MVSMFIALVFLVLSYYVSLFSEFHVEMSVTISTLVRIVGGGHVVITLFVFVCI